MAKARENLKIAVLSFEEGCYNACVNRAYFAAFHAAIAALADKGMLKKGKNDHKWVQSEFTLRLINQQKVYPGKIKSFLAEMQPLRNIADYVHIGVSKTAAKSQLSKAIEMIDLIEKEING